MIRLILSSIGFILAKTPTRLLQYLCDTTGLFVYHFTKRGPAAMRNLYYAFPELSEAERIKIAKDSQSRMLEMFLFTLVQPHLSDQRIEKILTVTDKTRELVYQESKENGMILLIPHTAMSEALVIFPRLFPKVKNIGVLYRPLDNEKLDQFANKVRSRFGLQLLSRKNALLQARDLLKSKGILAFQYDQNAGNPGALTTFFDRIVSTTDLPGIFAEKYQSHVCFLYPKRSSFWKAELTVEAYAGKLEKQQITEYSNLWLEKTLSKNSDQSCNWLWSHQRWKAQNYAHGRFQISHKKNYLETSLKMRNWKVLPAKSRFYVLLPNHLTEILIFLPILRTIRLNRPDLFTLLIADKKYEAFLYGLNLCEKVLILPHLKKDQIAFFKALRHEYPDTWIHLNEDPSLDQKAALSKSRLYLGIEQNKTRRPYLTNRWKQPNDMVLSQTHLFDIWQRFTGHYGLKSEINLQPLCSHQNTKNSSLIGIYPEENCISKDGWNLEDWHKLIQLIFERSPETELCIFKNSDKDEFTKSLLNVTKGHSVKICDTRQSLPDYAEAIKECSMVISEQAECIHLANALGTPAFGIFKNYHPSYSAPIYNSKSIILHQHPKNSPESSKKINPEEVIKVIYDAF